MTDVPAHDPGGKVRLSMMPGVTGDAAFSPCGRYRHFLNRDWGFRRFSDGRERFILWIGMNPSTAEAEIDDPTIRKEMGFTRRLGFDKYVKCNVMDYRATSPASLLLPGVTPCSDENLKCIQAAADRADLVVACWGKLHKSLRRHADRVLMTLKCDLYCLGKNNDGSPKHPLYLPNDTPLVPYRVKQ